MTKLDSTDSSTSGEKSRRFRWPAFTIVAIAIVAFFAGGFGGTFQGKLTEVQKNDNAAYLSSSAESTIVTNESSKFLTVETIPGFVLFHSDAPLTDQDKAAVAQAHDAIAAVDASTPKACRSRSSRRTAPRRQSSFPSSRRRTGTAVAGDVLAATEENVLTAAKSAATGLEVLPAGPGGLLVAFIDAFAGLDGALLGAALLVVVLILLVVYRSPVLWFFPLFSALLALGLASMVIYFLAKAEVLTLTGQSQGILFVLVIGAGTDYALLLISAIGKNCTSIPAGSTP